MNHYSKVAVASCGLLIATTMAATSNAQTRITASQLRAAQIRAAQTRAAQSRSSQSRTTQSRSSQTRSITRIPTQVRRVATPASATRSTASAQVTPKDKIPEAALLTERGSQLVDRLKQLRYSESQMGSRHPSLEDVREQIVSVKEELQAWVPAIKTKDADAKEGDEVQTAERALAQLNEEDLRQLVVRLSLDVYKLRNRVVELESKQKKISSLVVERK